MRPERRDQALFQEKYRYVCGPFITRAANGDWLVTWNMSIGLEVGAYSPRRYLHPPDNPEFSNYMIRSRDEGKTWEAPRVVPGFGWTGTEHISMCVLDNDDILATFYQRNFYPLAEGEKNQSHRYGWYHRPPYPWVVTHGGTFVHRSRDHGETWEQAVTMDPSPFISAYSRLNIVQLDADTLIWVAGAADPMFVPGQWDSPPFEVRNGLGNRLLDGELVRELQPRVHLHLPRRRPHLERDPGDRRTSGVLLRRAGDDQIAVGPAAVPHEELSADGTPVAGGIRRWRRDLVGARDDADVGLPGARRSAR